MAWCYSGLQEEEEDAYSEAYGEGEGEEADILAGGELSDIDVEDWDLEESKTGFGDDYVPYAEDLQTKTEDVVVHRQESSSAASQH